MERERALSPAALLWTRAARALRRSQNWIELVKFSIVGASGYVVNLAVYVALLRGAGLHYVAAAVCSFAVAVANNYTLVALGANLLLLRGLVAAGVDKIAAQAIAVVLVTPLNFVGNKLWSFRRR